jgi:hypothetical protein
MKKIVGLWEDLNGLRRIIGVGGFGVFGRCGLWIKGELVGAWEDECCFVSS